MSTVDDAIEAGAQVVGTYYAYEYAYHALIGAWPVLSAGLRRMHEPVSLPHRDVDRIWCEHCNVRQWPCPTVREIERIDKELGHGS